MWQRTLFTLTRDGCFEKDFFLLRKKSLFVSSGVNFTDVLQAAFTCADPKSTTKLLNLTVFFGRLGSAGVKAARIDVGEIDT